MKWNRLRVARVLGILSATALVQATSRAEDSAASAASAAPSTRYGLFDALDHRSWYNEGNFPEPFLVDDTGLELDEARLDWFHTKTGDQHSDTVKAEVEHGFGLTTLELAVPYERNVSPGGVEQGFGKIEVGARHPVYQYVSATGFFDNTLGVALEVGIPVYSAVSQNTELVPKLFNDLRLGEHFTVQSLLGYSMLFGGGEEGGLHVFEYGFVFGYSIPHHTLPIPGVQQFIPMFELTGETGLNKDEAGQTSVLGNACFRLYLNPVGRVQPRLGLGYVFPITTVARADIHTGFILSLVFEY